MENTAASEPFTMACWFYCLDNTTWHVLMSLGENGGPAGDFYYLGADGDDAGDNIWASAFSDPAQGTAKTTTGFSASTWHHAAAVFASSSSRSVYLDGGGKGTDSTSVTGISVARTAIGVLLRDVVSAGVHLDGSIAEAAVWDAALSDDEVAALAAGINTRHIRPANLKAYWPLLSYNPLSDFTKNGYDLTEVGTVSSSNHAPVRLFTPNLIMPDFVEEIIDDGGGPDIPDGPQYTLPYKSVVEDDSIECTIGLP
jgi:hypothetical protein